MTRLEETPWEELDAVQRRAAVRIHASDPQSAEIRIERCRFFVDRVTGQVVRRPMTVD